jgi:hypothetical protein
LPESRNLYQNVVITIAVFACGRLKSHNCCYPIAAAAIISLSSFDWHHAAITAIIICATHSGFCYQRHSGGNEGTLSDTACLWEAVGITMHRSNMHCLCLSYPEWFVWTWGDLL